MHFGYLSDLSVTTSKPSLQVTLTTCNCERWHVTLTFELDLDSMNYLGQRAICVGQRLFCSEVTTHAHRLYWLLYLDHWSGLWIWQKPVRCAECAVFTGVAVHWQVMMCFPGGIGWHGFWWTTGWIFPAQNAVQVWNNFIFTARRYASAVLAVVVCPSVCPSVCLSVTSRYCIETATHRITQTTPYGSPGNLVFWRQKSFRNSNGVAPKGGAKCRWGRVKSANFDK